MPRQEGLSSPLPRTCGPVGRGDGNDNCNGTPPRRHLAVYKGHGEGGPAGRRPHAPGRCASGAPLQLEPTSTLGLHPSGGRPGSGNRHGPLDVSLYCCLGSVPDCPWFPAKGE